MRRLSKTQCESLEVFEKGTMNKIFEVMPEGTVVAGKSRTQQTQDLAGIILKSPSYKWKLTVSDTGQVVLTKLT